MIKFFQKLLSKFNKPKKRILIFARNCETYRWYCKQKGYTEFNTKHIFRVEELLGCYGNPIELGYGYEESKVFKDALERGYIKISKVELV